MAEGETVLGFEVLEDLIRRSLPGSDEHKDQLIADLQRQREHPEPMPTGVRAADVLNQRYRRDCGLSGDMWSDTFESYKPEHASQGKAWRACQSFVKNWPNVKGKGFLLCGSAGCGKSHLMRATANALLTLDRPVNVRYYYVPQIERILREEDKHRKEYAETGRGVANTEKAMLACDVLLLDDISKLDAKVSGGWFLNTFGCLIDQAERTGQPIICASSNDDAYHLANSLGGPLVSRLSALMFWFEVQGRDLRAAGDTPDWAR